VKIILQAINYILVYRIELLIYRMGWNVTIWSSYVQIWNVYQDGRYGKWILQRKNCQETERTPTTLYSRLDIKILLNPFCPKTTFGLLRNKESIMKFQVSENIHHHLNEFWVSYLSYILLKLINIDNSKSQYNYMPNLNYEICNFNINL